jgi:hypothetical protein
MYCFELPNVLFWGLEASPVASTSFMDLDAYEYFAISDRK